MQLDLHSTEPPKAPPMAVVTRSWTSRAGIGEIVTTTSTAHSTCCLVLVKPWQERIDRVADSIEKRLTPDELEAADAELEATLAALSDNPETLR